MLALALEVAPLRELQGWEPVGALLEQLASALRGTQGALSAGQALALRRWAGRWAALAPQVRAFYARRCRGPGQPEGLVEHALWTVLEGEDRPPLTGRQRAALEGLWADEAGYAPQLDLCPRPRRYRGTVAP
jgi:hypothetical protein